MMHYMKLPVGYSERYHTVVTTYRIRAIQVLRSTDGGGGGGVSGFLEKNVTKV